MKTPESEINCTDPARRQFLQLAVLAGGVALLGGCAGSSSSDSNSVGTTYNPIKATKKSDGTIAVPGGANLKPGTAVAFKLPDGNRGIVFADRSGNLKAISALCTHQGCTVRWQGADKPLLCPCHGSTFDKDGTVLKGPATSPLATYKVRAEGKTAIIVL